MKLKHCRNGSNKIERSRTLKIPFTCKQYKRKVLKDFQIKISNELITNSKCQKLIEVK